NLSFFPQILDQRRRWLGLVLRLVAADLRPECQGKALSAECLLPPWNTIHGRQELRSGLRRLSLCARVETRQRGIPVVHPARSVCRRQRPHSTWREVQGCEAVPGGGGRVPACGGN